MGFDFTKYKESNNLIQLKLINKERYYLDLFNIEESWTGRIDAQISNTFFQESVQLIINAIVLFELGYFDCAFYSLRQSIEVSTTIIYLIDKNNPDQQVELAKWKSQSRFPMYSEMAKPGLLTTFRWEGYNLHTQLNNKYLTPAFGSQYSPDNYGQGR